jgi:ferrous iron transport protein A
MQLSEQKIGFIGEIKNISGDPILVGRLRELGFLKGSVVEVCGMAPFGAPLIVKVRGGKVALRKGEAACIQV